MEQQQQQQQRGKAFWCQVRGGRASRQLDFRAVFGGGWTIECGKAAAPDSSGDAAAAAGAGPVPQVMIRRREKRGSSEGKRAGVGEGIGGHCGSWTSGLSSLRDGRERGARCPRRRHCHRRSLQSHGSVNSYRAVRSKCAEEGEL